MQCYIHEEEENETEQECIHKHVRKLLMIIEREREKRKPVRKIRSAGLDTEEEEPNESGKDE